jgi:serine/threonine protein phosphatase PrpC
MYYKIQRYLFIHDFLILLIIKIERFMPIFSSATTHRGLVRKVNQDRLLNEISHLSFWVADGMGGAKAGEVAAEVAIEGVREGLNAFFVQTLQKSKNKNLKNFLEKTILDIHLKIQKLSQEEESLKGMGTTLCGVSWDNHLHEFLLFNIGDSRCYLTYDLKTFQLSRDHNWSEDLRFLDIPIEKNHPLHQKKNVITRALGQPTPLEIDIFQYCPPKDSLLLICSDGLHGSLTEDSLKTRLRDLQSELKDTKLSKSDEKVYHDYLQKGVNQLLTEALECGGRDNITFVLIYLC